MGCNQTVTTASLNTPEHYTRNIYSFKGIPYAEPPVKHLRFRKPLPLIYSKLTDIDSTHFGKACKQPPLRDSKNFLQTSEDCLFVNIFTPSLDPLANLPVMVYIHGGGFLFDSARQVPGEQLSLRDVIVVTMNYRLGVFGFMCTDREDAPGNMGLWDQAMAMNWTQLNIKNFGGNPNDITLFGQSVGSVSVSSHIVSDVSKGYFKRAIMQSGSSLTNVWLRSRDYSTRVAKRFAKFLGCNRSLAYIECLRTKSAEDLLAGQSSALLWNLHNPDAQPWYSAAILEFVQCFGDEFLPQSVQQLLDSGNYRPDLHVLTGHTNLESVQFTYIYDLLKARFGTNSAHIPDAVINTRIARHDIQKIMINNNTFDDLIAEEYTKSFDNRLLMTPFGYFERQRLRAAVVHSYSDYSFVCPTVLFGKNLVNNPKFTGKVYQYYLTYANSRSICHVSTWCLNTHFDDVPLVFGQPFFLKGFSDLDRKMSIILMDIFTTFAKTNNPPIVIGNEWPPYSVDKEDESGLNYLELNPKHMGRTYLNRYAGNNDFTPNVIQNCQFWEPILRSLF